MKQVRFSKKSMVYAISFILLFLLEVWIALYVHDNFIRPYVGDMLVVILLYCAIRCVIPEGVPWLPFYVFLFAVAVEVLQYFHLVELLSLQNCKPAAIILGSTFDWMDILCYFAGYLMLMIPSLIQK